MIRDLSDRAKTIWADITAGKFAPGIEPENTTYLRDLAARAADVQWASHGKGGRQSLIITVRFADAGHFTIRSQPVRIDEIGGRQMVFACESMAFAVLVRESRWRNRDAGAFCPLTELAARAREIGAELRWRSLAHLNGVTKPKVGWPISLFVVRASGTTASFRRDVTEETLEAELRSIAFDALNLFPSST